MFLAPFVLLSLLNRFFFGKIVGVANDEGLHLENAMIPWKDIQQIVYKPEISSRYKLRFTSTTIVVAPPQKVEYTLHVLHFPRYGLKKIKKYCPDITVKENKEGIFISLLVSLVVIIAMAVIASLT